MKRFAFAVLLVLTQALVAQASPDMTYDHIPDPTYKLVRLGSRWVIQDARGFFVGYYVAPRPKPQPYTPSYPAPRARSLSGSNSFGGASGFNSGYSYYNGDFGFNEVGYGYNYGPGFGPINNCGSNRSFRSNSSRRSGFSNGFSSGCSGGFFNSGFSGGGFNNGFNSCNRPQPQFREQPRTPALVPIR